MKLLLDFFKTILKMPKPWVAWVILLVAANLLFPLSFLETPEAWVVLSAFAIGAVAQMAIFNKKGFVRLLGVGHAHWLPMVFWLWMRFDQAMPRTPFAYWLLAVIVLDGISLVIDSVDVIRYARGDRAPTVSLGKG